MKNDQPNFKVAEKVNGLAALVGCAAAFLSYGFTGHLIPGVL